MAWGPVRYVSWDHRAGRIQEGSWLVGLVVVGMRLCSSEGPQQGFSLRPRFRETKLALWSYKSYEPGQVTLCVWTGDALKTGAEEARPEIQRHSGAQAVYQRGRGSDETRAATSAWPVPPESSLTSHGTTLRWVEQNAPISCTAQLSPLSEPKHVTHADHAETTFC